MHINWVCLFVGAALFALALLAVAAIRLRQFAKHYRALMKESARHRPRSIILFEHYQGTSEWTTRVYAAKALYKKLCAEGISPRIILAVGKIVAYGNLSGAELDKSDLIRAGISPDCIDVYLPSGKGAVDTFEEVKLACRLLRERGQNIAYAIANPLQAVIIFYVCIWNGVWPQLEIVPLEEERPFYALGKLVQYAFLLFDPNARNPLAWWIRLKRRHIGGEI